VLQAGTSAWVAARALVGASVALGSLFIAAAATGGVASAQAFVAETISEQEIEQRLKFARLSTQREPSREDVIADLRAEKQRLLKAQLVGIEVADSAVDEACAAIAKRAKLSPEQLSEMLARSGVDADTLRQRIRVDLAWHQYVRQKRQDDPPSWRE
jgi:peptidyl-prolyl cis-trans isomerase SurA